MGGEINSLIGGGAAAAVQVKIERMEEEGPRRADNNETDGSGDGGVGVISSDPNWRDGKDTSELLKYIFNHDEGTRKDVTFLVGPNSTSILANKFIVSIYSPLLDYLVYDSDAAKEVRRGHLHVKLEDSNPYAFKEVLRYLYCKELMPGSIDEMLSVIEEAKKFEILPLISKYVGIVEESFYENDRNAMKALHMASTINHEGLKQTAIDFIARHARRIFGTRDWYCLTRDCMREIFKSDKLMLSELEVFYKMYCWADRRIGKRNEGDVKISGLSIREELGDLLHLIRFPSMSPEDFRQVTFYTGILTDGEQKEILQYYLYKTLTTTTFSCEPREIGRLAPAGCGSPPGAPEESVTINSNIDNHHRTSLDDGPPRKIPKIINNSTGEPTEPEPIAGPSSSFQAAVNDSNAPSCNTSHTHPDPTIDVVVDNHQNSSSNGQDSPGENVMLGALLDPEQEAFVKLNLSGEDSNNILSEHEVLSVAMAEYSTQSMSSSFVRDSTPLIINIPDDHSLEPISMPSLHSFIVKYLYSRNSVPSFLKYLESLDLRKTLLFVRTMEDDTGSLDLWITKTNVRLDVNGVCIVMIDHHLQTLCLSRVKKSAPDIIQGLNFDGSVKNLYIDNIELASIRIIPFQNLRHLTLRKITVQADGIRATHLHECVLLQELSCDDFRNGSLDVRTDLKLFGGSPLRKIAIAKARLTCNKPPTEANYDSQMKELYLDDCEWDNNFVLNFHLIFPNLERVQITTRNDLKLVLNALDIRSLRYMVVSNLQLKPPTPTVLKNGTRMIQKLSPDVVAARLKMIGILQNAGLTTPPDPNWLFHEDKAFILNEEPTSPVSWAWKGTKIPKQEERETLRKINFENFGYNKFYLDYELFKKLES